MNTKRNGLNLNTLQISDRFARNELYTVKPMSDDTNNLLQSIDSEPFLAAKAIVEALRTSDHVAYLAGGCVRDLLLDRQPKDFDVATDATPDQVRAIFRSAQFVGEAFGVSLVRHPDYYDHPTEVATFRKEAGYDDHRRPSEVHFTNAEQDAQRRDFTINGLFLDPTATDNPIIDYVGGVADLESQTLRAIGDPDERFAEDYLRMLRAARFASRLSFDLHPNTANAIRALAKHLGQISRERIGNELQNMLTSGHAYEAALLIQQLRLDAPVLNESHQRTELPTLQQLDSKADYPTQLAAWLIDRHQSEAEIVTPTFSTAVDIALTKAGAIIQRWRKALCMSNEHRDALNSIFNGLDRAHDWPKLRLADRKRLLAQPITPELLMLLDALGDDSTRIPDELRAAYIELANDGIGLAPEPLVNGQQLINLGLKPSPLFSKILRETYSQQLEGDLRREDITDERIQQIVHQVESKA